jgi:Fic family protein
MQPSDFTKDAPGTFVTAIGGQQAFVPDPLPPVIQWAGDLVSVISEADRALGELAGLGRDMANPHLLIGPFVRREAVLSSQIEGTHASVPDLLFFEVDEQVERDVPDVREVVNYIQTLEYALDPERRLPLGLRLIRGMHGVLMTGVRGENRSPGAFRRNQVHIGSPVAGIEEATFVPPPPNHLGAALDAFEKYLHAPSALPPVVRLALTHYQFEAIHPFADGNGRIGRLLISLMLCLDGILPGPLLYLSAYFHQTRQEYYRQLLQVSQRGTWTEWIIYFAKGVALQAADATRRAQDLRDLQTEYLDRIRTARTSALLTAIIEKLFERPTVKIADIAKEFEISYSAAQRHVQRLEEVGILRQWRPNRKRNRVFVADDVLRVAYDAVAGT